VSGTVKDGPELEATGPSRIFSATQTSSLFSRITNPSSNNDAVVAKLDAVQRELERLRQDNSAENRSIARSNRGIQSTLERVTRGGNAMVMTTDDAGA
jgi:hypothetical protein